LPQAFMPALTGKVDLQRRIQANAYAALLELTELMNAADRSKFEFYPDQQNRVALESAFARRAAIAVGESVGGDSPGYAGLPEACRALGPGYGGLGQPGANGRAAEADRPRLRSPSVPFDRIFLVDQENEGSISWSSMDSVSDMVAQSLLVNIVYR